MQILKRAVAVIIKDNEVLLMERRKNDKKYFTFPGGGVENEETVNQAVLREVMEETSLIVKIVKKLYVHFLDSPTRGRSNQYFYLCSYIKGEPKLGEGNEKENMKKGGNFYLPQWVSLDKLPNLLLYPLEIRDWLLEDIKNNFTNTPKSANLKVEDLRREI